MILFFMVHVLKVEYCLGREIHFSVFKRVNLLLSNLGYFHSFSHFAASLLPSVFCCTTCCSSSFALASSPVLFLSSSVMSIKNKPELLCKPGVFASSSICC